VSWGIARVASELPLDAPDAVRGVTVCPFDPHREEFHMSTSVLSAEAVRRALSIRDLTDPAQGAHAMQQLVAACADRLVEAWRCPACIHRAGPIVSIADNYDRLRYPSEGVARDARYTRYVCDVALLRTQTSAMVPPLLRRLAESDDRDVLLVCPGLVYRRDCIDRLHTGEPHQLDLWRVRQGAGLGKGALQRMVATIVDAVLPGRQWRVLTAEHPYTIGGLQIDVRDGSSWVEVGECGLAHPEVLSASGLSNHSGLAMGLGLDRLLMLRKGIDDIRLLRATDPRVATQMLDLSPYRAVSSMPPVRRDLSIVVRATATSEELGDRVRAALGDRADAIETVDVVSETSYDSLPRAARTRLRMSPDQKNVLLRVVLRDLARTLTHDEANELRDAIYAAVHEGEVKEWAARGSP
jgi:phenylalanyl-tRNA synthetase alpha chain